jgi:integrase
MQKKQAVVSKAPGQKLVATRAATLGDGTYTDPGQTGLQLRVRTKRDGKATRSWLLRFKFKGEETRIVLGHFPETTLDAARGHARQAREQASQGIDPRRAGPRRRRVKPLPASSAAPTGSKHSIEFLAHEFMEKYVRPGRDRPEYVEAVLKKDVLTEWAGRDARSITPREVIELLDGIVERGSKVMANRTGAIVAQMFKYGIHRTIVDDSPVKLLVRPGGKETARERCLSDDELKILLRNPPTVPRFERLGHAIMIYLLTAVRRSELALARWSEIDFEAKLWKVPAAHVKGRRGERRGHTVPLSDWAVREFQALQRLAKRGARYVLPNVAGDGPIDPKLLTRNLARAQTRMKELGITEFTLHDLRRTLRTGLSKLKGADGKAAVPRHVAERVLNHKQETIEAAYDKHDYLDEQRAALEKWAHHLNHLRH